jgi:hypothetical protein
MKESDREAVRELTEIFAEMETKWKERSTPPAARSSAADACLEVAWRAVLVGWSPTAYYRDALNRALAPHPDNTVWDKAGVLELVGKILYAKPSVPTPTGFA